MDLRETQPPETCSEEKSANNSNNDPTQLLDQNQPTETTHPGYSPEEEVSDLFSLQQAARLIDQNDQNSNSKNQQLHSLRSRNTDQSLAMEGQQDIPQHHNYFAAAGLSENILNSIMQDQQIILQQQQQQQQQEMEFLPTSRRSSQLSASFNSANESADPSLTLQDQSQLSQSHNHQQQVTNSNQYPFLMTQQAHPLLQLYHYHESALPAVHPFSNSDSAHLQRLLGTIVSTELADNTSAATAAPYLAHPVLYSNSVAAARRSSSCDDEDDDTSNEHQHDSTVTALNVLQQQLFDGGDNNVDCTDPQQQQLIMEQQLAVLRRDSSNFTSSTSASSNNMLNQSATTLQEQVPFFNSAATYHGSGDMTDNSSSGQTQLPAKPKRPLSAYNLFFKEERERLLQEHLKAGNQNDFMSRSNRKRKKSSVGFEQLGKIIGERWKNLDVTTKNRLQYMADQDKKRYHIELERWKEIKYKALSEQQAILERSVDQRTRDEYFYNNNKPTATDKMLSLTKNNKKK